MPVVEFKIEYPWILDAVHINVFDPGIDNWKEFVPGGLILFTEKAAHIGSSDRFCAGYVSFGWVGITDFLRPGYLEPAYVNWQLTVFQAPIFETPVNLVRIWMRKGVSASIHISKHREELSATPMLILPRHP